jgi:phage-related protein
MKPRLILLNSQTSTELIKIAWEGDTEKVISSFPDDIKRDLGFQLYKLQKGEIPDDFKPMTSIGSGVCELRESDERSWYRVIYLSKIEHTIYVLHCFEKKTNKTSKPDIETAKIRLKRVRSRIMEKKK